MTEYNCTKCGEDIKTGSESDGCGLFSVEGLPFCCLRHCDLWKLDHNKPLEPRPVRELRIDSGDRVESGPVKFAYSNGDKDGAGLFLRGDHALYLAMTLATVLDDPEVKASIVESHSEFMLGILKGIAESLSSVREVPSHD